jgi:hypothetical protein
LVVIRSLWDPRKKKGPVHTGLLTRLVRTAGRTSLVILDGIVPDWYDRRFVHNYRTKLSRIPTHDQMSASVEIPSGSSRAPIIRVISLYREPFPAGGARPKCQSAALNFYGMRYSSCISARVVFLSTSNLDLWWNFPCPIHFMKRCWKIQYAPQRD